MQHQPRQRPDPFPKKKWREYADKSKSHHDDNFIDLMKRCNQRAKTISHKAQVTSTAWEDEYWDSGHEAIHYEKHWWRKLFALFVLLPAAVICAMSLGSQLVEAQDKVGILLAVPVWYTLMGALVWFILARSKLCIRESIYAYVLAHELTHALAILLSLGKISGFRVDVDGGHVQTNKNNIFIALSPYFIPLWAIAWAALFAAINLFYPLNEFQEILYGGIGFWWAFHLFWTVWMIPKDQPDLKENDTLFSLMFIYLSNLLLLIVMLALCEIVDLQRFAVDFVSHSKNMWHMLKDFIGLFR